MRGKNTDTGDDLYNIMPLNAKLTLTHKIGGWDNALEIEGVSGKKSRRRPQRNPDRLLRLLTRSASYSWRQARLDFGVANLFDRGYALPNGGAYTARAPPWASTASPGASPSPAWAARCMRG